MATVILASVIVVLPAAAGTSSACWNTKKAERKLVRHVNKARGDHGRVKLRFDPELSRVARVHTKEMMRRGELFHSKKLGERVTKWRVLGENVGRGNGARELHRMFMSSETHRANVVHKRFRHVGVGVKRDSRGLWVTVVFQGTKKNPGTTLKMPSC